MRHFTKYLVGRCRVNTEHQHQQHHPAPEMLSGENDFRHGVSQFRCGLSLQEGKGCAVVVAYLFTPNILLVVLMKRLLSASSTLSLVNCGFMPSNLQVASTCSTMNFGWK